MLRRLPCLLLLAALLTAAAPQRPRYPSPAALAFSPDGRLLVVADAGLERVVILDAASRRTLKTVGVPHCGGLAWDADGRRLWASLGAGREVAEVDVAGGRVKRRLAVGLRPGGLAYCAARKLLLVGNSTGRSLSLLDADSGRPRGTVTCSGEPSAVAVTPKGDGAVVVNLSPVGDATDAQDAAVVDLVNLESLATRPVRLPAGGGNVFAVAISPDGRWAYVPHVLARFNLPTTQAERGWINTNAVSIIDLAAGAVYATVLLDHLDEGAADPWGVAAAPDGRTLWVALSGVHKLARLDLGRLHELLAGQVPEALAKSSPEYGLTAQNAWQAIAKDPAQRTLLADDLTALHQAGVLEQRALPGKGPRGLALSPDGAQLAVAEYFSGQVTLLATNTGALSSVPVGESPAPDLARRGELAFCDAGRCFQQWHSCATCHPQGGRADGFNWDLLNDGIGNPKNTRSLVLADRREPLMSLGVRGEVGEAVTAGFRFINFREPAADDVAAVVAYIGSLQPEPSPYRGPHDELTPAAARGKKLFDDPGVGCARCHGGPQLTDGQLHDVGTQGELDRSPGFVTPTLVEVWRTAPYLHDGRAVSIEELLTRYNQRDRHGVTAQLSQKQIAELAEYVRSL